MNAVLWVQIVSVFIGILFTTVNLLKGVRGHSVSSANFFIMSAAWTAFVTVTWLMEK